MVWLILAMVICLALAAAVVGIVAVPARREGRQVLTPKGEDMVSSVARRTDKAVTTAKGATGSALQAARIRSSTGDDPSVAGSEATREAS